MYEPLFNSVLVQIDDKDAQWGSGNDDSMLGKSYSKGKVIRIGTLLETKDYPDVMEQLVIAEGTILDKLVGRSIMWNEGVEAGTTFEHEGKMYGFIYWHDIRGVLNA
jgi:hypothetical protein